MNYIFVILTSIECDGCNEIGDSTYGEGLSTGGPWNHPLIDSLDLSSVNTSATCQLEILCENKNKIVSTHHYTGKYVHKNEIFLFLTNNLEVQLYIVKLVSHYC